MKRGAPIKRKAPLRYYSPKREAERDARRELVARIHARDVTCQAVGKIAHVCHPRLDVHEIIPRSAWRAGYLVDDNCVLVCATAHFWIDNHPDEAEKVGLHGKSWQRP